MPGLLDSASAPAYSGAAFLHHNPFDQLRQSLDRPLRYVARGLTTNAAIQEELHAEGLLAVFLALDSFDPEGGASLATYAFKCAGNRMRDYMRLERRHTRGWVSCDAPADGDEGLTLFEQIANEGRRIEEPYFQFLLAQAVMFIEALPERQKHCMQLHFLEGLEPAEVAGRMKISKPRVTQLVAAAMIRLRYDFGINQPGTQRIQ
jgi:RNA polymerase sporulation-specific sigma factor